ncbi:MAG: TetR/AcrR family transcriptional regulator [Solirubrobacterales bacterium]
MSPKGAAARSVFRSKLTQQRSRERAEQILDIAAAELLDVRDAEKVTTTWLSTKAKMPVATIYRYFADRWAIFAALIDRQIDNVDRELLKDLRAVETVTLVGVFTVFMEAHFRHFSANSAAAAVWFGARGSDVVRLRVRERCNEMAHWIQDGAAAAGLADEFPPWGGEALIWTADRAFEVMFRVERSEEERRAIFDEALEMMGNQLEKYATPAGLEGIPAREFLIAAGPFKSAGDTHMVTASSLPAR